MIRCELGMIESRSAVWLVLSDTPTERRYLISHDSTAGG